MKGTTEEAQRPQCSFCRKSPMGDMVAGPGVCICDACIGLCQRILTGKPTAPFAGWQSMSDEELLAALPAAEAAVHAVAEKLQEHVDMLRMRNVSWERIGTALGVSRQAAWERFSREH